METLENSNHVETKKKVAKKKATKPAPKNLPFKAHLLASDILAIRAKKELSYQDIAEATKLSAPIVHRAASKQGIAIDSLVKIANFLNYPIYRYF